MTIGFRAEVSSVRNSTEIVFLEAIERKHEMKIATLIAFSLLGLIFVAVSLNGQTGQSIVAKEEKSYAQGDKNLRYALWQTKAKRRQAMSFSISTLLTRNLYDVFGENDSARRRAAINEIYTEDIVFYEPSGKVYRGRDEIARVADAIRTAHADAQYQPIAEPEVLGNAGRIRWLEGRPGEAPTVAGTDFIIARDGRIAAIYLFFDKLPESR